VPGFFDSVAPRRNSVIRNLKAYLGKRSADPAGQSWIGYEVAEPADQLGLLVTLVLLPPVVLKSFRGDDEPWRRVWLPLTGAAVSGIVRRRSNHRVSG
jgi:hypothetical protein